jgi:hypothetical protein
VSGCAGDGEGAALIVVGFALMLWASASLRGADG